jgi:hypothetical protein
MTETFDAATLDLLRDTTEVAIRTSANPKRSIVIWVIVVGDGVFVRSVRGAGAKWYASAVADGQATLELDDGRWPVSLATVSDPAVIGEVSQAYLAKYATSPYAKEMVRSEILSTTLRLDPL